MLKIRNCTPKSNADDKKRKMQNQAFTVIGHILLYIYFFLLFFAFYFFKHPEVLQEAYQEMASSELDTGSCRILLPGEEEQNSYQMRPEQRSAAE